MTKNRFVGIIGVTIAFFVFVIIFIFCTCRINPGYAGVIYNMDGGIEGETLAQGFHVVAPWKHVTAYPISTETVYYTRNTMDENGVEKDKSINVNTKDGKQVNVSITYTYHMDVNVLPIVFEKFRGQKIELIESGYMKNSMFEVVNNITSQYSLMELVGDKRPEINDNIFNAFRENLSPYGIVIESFNLSSVETDDQTKEAIEAVINSQNRLQQSKVELQKAEVEAETARVKARGEADAMIIQAEGQAEANAKLQTTLTDNVIEQRRIEKWDGKLPQIVGSDGVIIGGNLMK